MDKQELIQNLNRYLSFVTIIGGMTVILLGVYVVYVSFSKKESKDLQIVANYAVQLGFLATFFSMVMSLYYSEYLGILPCDLCWFQRIFIYSQVILFTVAWWKKDKGVFTYSLPLSLVGIVIALYHHIMQLGYNVYKPCSTAPFALDCSKPTFIEFGFVTFPLMAVVLFAFLILLAKISKMKKS
jgi:disulfide bond formation protein DsbB